MSPVCYSDPGMTRANMQFVEVDVDADSEANAAVNPELEVRLLGFLAQGLGRGPWLGDGCWGLGAGFGTRTMVWGF